MKTSVNLTDLKDYFKVNRKEAAGFILMLVHLKPGDKFQSVIGRIDKLDEDTFKLSITDNVLSRLLEDWVEDEEESIFE